MLIAESHHPAGACSARNIVEQGTCLQPSEGEVPKSEVLVKLKC